MKTKHAGRVPEYLQHILDVIDRATGYIKGMDLPGFEGDTRTQDAVIRSIEIIGEAANNPPASSTLFGGSLAWIPRTSKLLLREGLIYRSR